MEQFAERIKDLASRFTHSRLEVPRLVVGTGTGALPIIEEVKREAARREIELLVLPTTKAIAALKKNPKEANAILHVTC
jgi:hypothetical protein